MLDIGSEVRARRQRLGWTVQKLATLAEITPSFLSRLERGKTYYSRETVMKLAGALGISADKLYVSQGNAEEAPRSWRQVPVLGYREAATWTLSSMAEPGQHETIITRLEHPASTFALRLRDDSNAPKYQADDIVVVDPTIQPRFGDMVVAASVEGDSHFAQYRDAGINERGDRVFELHPLNEIYAAMRSDRQQLAIVGTMVEYRSYRRKG